MNPKDVDTPVVKFADVSAELYDGIVNIDENAELVVEVIIRDEIQSKRRKYNVVTDSEGDESDEKPPSTR